MKTEESPPTIKGHSHKRALETEGNHSETRPLQSRMKFATILATESS